MKFYETHKGLNEIALNARDYFFLSTIFGNVDEFEYRQYLWFRVEFSYSLNSGL